MNAIDPLPFTLIDGSEKHFLLRLSHLKKATEAARGNGNSGGGAAALAGFGMDVLIRSLYDAMTDKGGMTREEFEDLLPGDPEILNGFFEALQKHCSPAANEKYRPQKSQ
jgi:hypothetical protein